MSIAKKMLLVFVLPVLVMMTMSASKPTIFSARVHTHSPDMSHAPSIHKSNTLHDIIIIRISIQLVLLPTRKNYLLFFRRETTKSRCGS